MDLILRVRRRPCLHLFSLSDPHFHFSWSHLAPWHDTWSPHVSLHSTSREQVMERWKKQGFGHQINLDSNSAPATHWSCNFGHQKMEVITPTWSSKYLLHACYGRAVGIITNTYWAETCHAPGTIAYSFASITLFNHFYNPMRELPLLPHFTDKKTEDHRD